MTAHRAFEAASPGRPTEHVPERAPAAGLLVEPADASASAKAARLEENLRALAIRSPRVADAIARATARTDLVWTCTAQDGAWSAELEGRALASKRRPLDEAAALASAVDLKKAAGVVVLGFGLGYHVAEISRRGGEHTAVIVFEPDVPLLRAVFEHADFSRVLRSGLIFLFTDADDGAALHESLSGLEGMVSVGIEVVEHVPSRARLGELGPTFARAVTKFAGALRMQVITTLANMQTTFRNMLMNLDEYAGGAGIAEIKDKAKGLPAIVVSAGPSLERNIALLEDPRVRERVVIIAVQTVLKPLLARGITPHFVTALDFHEISARFYEGLTADAVRGVTLVAEPKANPAILQSFPGPVRLSRSDAMDWLLGDELAPAHGEIQPGATVAHLAYALARHLGCDPVLLVGQDLAFTDGQYYSAGAAIHDVWGTELSEFNTLEMMEWQRIIRWRGHLHRVNDHLGRTVYTDDQMSTYLAHFEKLFLADAERGLRTIDATEGGAAKAYTTAMPLAEALGRFAPEYGPRVPDFGTPPRAVKPTRRLKERVKQVRDGVRAVAHTCNETAALLETMAEHHADQQRVNRLIDRVHGLQDRVKSHEPAYSLVHRLNQSGSFRRFKADRELALCDPGDPMERQRLQIERDRTNVKCLGDSAQIMDEVLGATLEMLDGGPRLTRDHAAPKETRAASTSPASRVGALVVQYARADGSADATPGARTFLGSPVSDLVMQRLARVPGLCNVETITVEPPAAHASIRAARAWSSMCWRGGLGGLTCYDEILDPASILAAMDPLGLDAALVVGADWALVDPALCAQVVERHQESPDEMPLVFTQAPPGLCGVLISRRLCADLANGRAQNDLRATIGGMLGFHPMRPALDPVSRACCVQIDGAVRSSPWRYVVGWPEHTWLEAALAHTDGASIAAADVVRRCESHASAHGVGPARCLTLDLVDGWRSPVAEDLIARFAAESPGGAVTITGTLASRTTSLVSWARTLGLLTHVRTDAQCDSAIIDALLCTRPDVISVDLHAVTRETYRALTGGLEMDVALLNVERMLAARRFAGGLPTPWIVPRITRRDEVYEEIEGFFDRGLVFAGACVIDALPSATSGARIAPLPLPRNAATRQRLTERRVTLGPSHG